MSTPTSSALPPPAVDESSPDGSAIALSIVVPVYNEEENVDELYAELTTAAAALGRAYEVVVVDDGSRRTRRTPSSKLLAAGDPRLKVIQLRPQLRPDRRDGGRLRLRAGRRSSSRSTATSRTTRRTSRSCSSKLDEGYDVVSGWRKDRKDSVAAAAPVADRQLADRPRHRRAPARLRLHAQGLPRRRSSTDMRLYGEMHRFLPALAYQEGARITEIPVRHHPRRYGQSKYGLGRTLKVVLDLITVKFLSSYGRRSRATSSAAAASSSALGGNRGRLHRPVPEARERRLRLPAARRPRRRSSSSCSGFTCILMGLLAELIVRTYHESQAKPIYRVRERAEHRAARGGRSHLARVRDLRDRRAATGPVDRDVLARMTGDAPAPRARRRGVLPRRA